MQKSFQPKEEKDAERKLITDFADKIEAEVIKLQDNIDDCGTDGVIKFKDKLLSVEARRKGYPNHKGRACPHPEGWKTNFLTSGIFLNESVIRRHKENKEDFIYLVDVLGGVGENKWSETRVCKIDESRMDELLKQPYRLQESTNASGKQSVKMVPLEWFKKVF